MVKFVGLSATVGLSNTPQFAPGNFWGDVYSAFFTLVGTPASTVTNTNVSIVQAPVTVSMTGKFHTELDGPPPAGTGPVYTGTVKSITATLNGALTYKLTKLDLPLNEIRNSGSSVDAVGSTTDANVLMSEIFRGNDKIIGTEATDVVRGYAGNDVLLGKGSIDKMFGDGGRDLLDGGLGNDSLGGRNGKDIFRFSTAIDPVANIDRITDFEHKDQIQLSHHIFTKLGSSGHLAAGNFVIGPAALDANDYIIFDSTNGKTYYDADGNGPGAAIQFAKIEQGGGVTAIVSHNDFDLI